MLVLLVCMAAVLGTASVAAASSASLPATITGYVKDVSNNPIDNVKVVVDGEMASFPYSFTQTALTDATGKFVITDVIQGTYSMRINEPDNPGVTLAAWGEQDPWHGDWASDPPVDTRHYVLGGTTLNAGTIQLPAAGSVHGRAMDGGSPVAGAQVVASVVNNGITYRRWAETAADGSFTITNATPGEWTLVYYATRAGKIPDDPVPGGFYGTDYDPVAQSQPEGFTLLPGENKTLANHEFSQGQLVQAGCNDEYKGFGYQVSAMGVTAYDTAFPGDWEHAYSWQVGDDGWGRTYLPPGTWSLEYADMMDPQVYETATLPDFSTTWGGGPLNKMTALTPKVDTYALHGHLAEAGTNTTLTAWVSASKINPSSVWLEYYRRVPSLGATYGNYMIRLPKLTGYTGNRMKLQWSDQAAPPDGQYIHVTQEATISPAASADTTRNITMAVGGAITGTVRDETGARVPGVTVWVTRKAFDPTMGEVAWTGGENWWVRADANGDYRVGGLPSGSDYKVNFYPDYNPGMLLPIKYRDYNRRVYQAQPLVDSLNTSVGAPVVDHTPVAVTAPSTTASIDETIVPGGYVGLHADGPSYPTGAVYCDVWYAYKGHWFEIDSGYTTGGTFQKIWKVLPAGTYRLDYNDYFGRGGGSWSFALAGGQTKFASVLVPAPSSIVSGSSLVKGSFAGLLGGGLGLPDGGTGGTQLKFQLGSVPVGAPALPSGTIGAGSVYNVSLTSGAAAGVWTLTIPYDPSIPAADVPYLRVIHYKTGGGTETLTPRAYNTTAHTLQVQTTSLSPFRPVFRRHAVRLGTPTSTSSTWTRYRARTVYGSLIPRHTAGAKSVKLLIYRKNSLGKYKYYTYRWATNANYSSYTRYSVKFALKAGRYRIYAYAPSDKWHLATKTASYKSIYVK